MGGQEIKNALGSNIKLLRTQRQFSQEILAEKADISTAYLSKIERGIKYPKPDILSQIAEGLGVEVHELFKTNTAPAAKPIAKPADNKKMLKRLSKIMIKKVNHTMETVFDNFIK